MFSDENASISIKAGEAKSLQASIKLMPPSASGLLETIDGLFQVKDLAFFGQNFEPLRLLHVKFLV